MPLFYNFAPADYGHKGKVWSIDSAPNGIIYMAADKGLLEFDGQAWNSFKGSKGFTRSLLVINDSLIYTGSDHDFGRWQKDVYQQWQYQSLYPYQELVQEVVEEFWQVHRLKEDIIFVSSQHLYVATAKELLQVAAPYKITKSWQIAGAVFVSDEQKGLFRFDGRSLQPVFVYPPDDPLQIEGLYQDQDRLVLATRNAGLLRYEENTFTPIHPELSGYLEEAKIFSFEEIGEDRLAFGTVLSGLFITDRAGRIIHQINKNKGLLNNTVLSQYYSPGGQLWLGLDYGISSLDLHSPFTAFYDNRGAVGAASSALLLPPHFYLGTNQGLYHSSWAALDNSSASFSFQLLPKTAGQVWTMEKVGEQLLIGHDKGLFLVEGNLVKQLDSRQGVWDILPYKDYLLTGNYNGIAIFEKVGDTWKFLRKMAHIAGSCNQLLMEADSILWINIPNYGVVRTLLDQNLIPINRQLFSSETFQGEEFFLQQSPSGIQLQTDAFLYTYQPQKQTFIEELMLPHPLEAILDKPTAKQQARALDTSYVFYPLQNGFLLQHTARVSLSAELISQLVIRKTVCFNTHEKQAIRQGSRIPFSHNNVRIEYIVPHADPTVWYQYRTNRGDWSTWTKDTKIELLGLRAGKHLVEIRTKIAASVSEPISTYFFVAPPWYQTRLAYACYFLLAALIIFLLIQRWTKSLRKQERQMALQKQKALGEQAEKHQQQLLLLEQERLAAENRQVKQELKSKTIELAVKAKENEEKNRLLIALKEKMEAAQAKPNQSKMNWRDIERLLDAHLDSDDKTFEIQMDELHQDFLRALKKQFPNLSRNDLRLCVYLKIGISSKEIAEIFNIQPSSFYISRSRLRKKLNLEPEQKLYDFLNTVE